MALSNYDSFALDEQGKPTNGVFKKAWEDEPGEQAATAPVDASASPRSATTDKPRKPWRCFDCGRPPPDYRVRDAVWREAWPDYAEFKREMVTKYKGTPDDRLRYLLLCFDCLEERLGRTLTPDDFDLRYPVNHGIRLGLRMGTGGWTPRMVSTRMVRQTEETR